MAKPDPGFLKRAEKALRQRGWEPREAPKDTRKLAAKDAHVWFKRFLGDIWSITTMSLRNPNVALRVYVVERELNPVLMRWISGRAHFPERTARPPIDLWVSRRNNIPIMAWSEKALEAIDETKTGKFHLRAYKTMRRQK